MPGKMEEMIGQGGTMFVGNDQYPITIVGSTVSGKTIGFRIDGHDEGEVRVARLSKYGFYNVQNSKAWVKLGQKNFYQDPHQ
jgi:hypothetical protein